MNEPLAITLWLFPREDFDAWANLVGEPIVSTYGEYLNILVALQADQERQGRVVVRVDLSVDEMKKQLAARGLENTTDGRAAVTALIHTEGKHGS